MSVTSAYVVKNAHKPMHPLLIPTSDSSYLPQTKYDPFEDRSEVPRISVFPNEEVISLLPPIETIQLNDVAIVDAAPSKKRKMSCNTQMYGMPIIKRKQRSGPSCNYCRVKKTRCDAAVTVLYQDKSVTRSLNDMLFHILSKNEKEETIKMITKEVGISADVLTTIEDSTSCIVKQIDKIILLEPCSCCCKIRNRVETDVTAEFTGDCTFSNGMTRKDITTFTNIFQACPEKKNIMKLTIFDYEKAGYII
ncbi:hypothetical protein C6P45_001989 [Maudiozyma exigua]|uniref:Uncharacterized protein n=1 Tax=Maudiozyma exigua TaxID=34358 RepID=A0A9P7BBQ4_MAUEX|nr:hypothetical protein C6P45_001989 [Kazachstania exigua]